MKSNKYRSICIFFIFLTILSIILLIVIPTVLEHKTTSDIRLQSLPDSNNADLWGKFPGRLLTTLQHTFHFFNYSSSSNSPSPSLIASPITFMENISYTNYTYDAKVDQIQFTSQKWYSTSSSPVANITLPSLGLFETLETLSHPPLYQEGINSIQFLMKQTLGSSDEFIRKLFTVYAFDSLMYDKERIMETLLKDIAEEKKENVYAHEVYGVGKVEGFYKWVYVIDDADRKTNAKWMNDMLNLTSTEIDSIIGTKSLLGHYFKFFNYKLVNDFKCEGKVCGNELLYKQLMDSSITTAFGVKDFMELNAVVDPNYYKVDYSPEMDLFFREIFINHEEYSNLTYDDVMLSNEQISMLFDEALYADIVVTDPSNAMKLLNYNKTDNLYDAFQMYKVKSIAQLHFITNYIFEYLPTIFLYPSFTYNNNTYKINPLSKSFTSFLQFMITDSYDKLIKNANLYHIVLAKLSYHYILQEMGEDNLNDVCPILLQRVLGQGKKVLQICSDPELAMNSYSAIKYWIKPYECVFDPTLVCDRSILYHLEHLAGLSDEDIKKIYSEDSLGKYIIKADAAARETYNCGTTCSDDNLSELQYTSSYITRNPPKDLNIEPCDSISEWDSEEFPTPIEMFYFQKELQCEESDCNGKSNEVVLSLYNTSANIFDNPSALKNKHDLEVVFTLYMDGIVASEYTEAMNVSNATNFIGVYNELLQTSLFNGSIYQTYSSDSILYGNNDEDAGYVNLLNKGGFYDNFKPNMTKTTGFNIYLNKGNVSNDNDDLGFDVFDIQTAQNDETQTMRRIVNINGQPILNAKKKEYSSIKGKFIDIEASLYNFASIDGDLWFSDGYQFPIDKDKIYYYDEMSSRVFEFKYKSHATYNDISCRKYILNKDNLTLGLYENDENTTDTTFAHVKQRFNKPMVVSTIDAPTSFNIDHIDVDNDDNYFCVDEFSQMVIKANLTLMYSMQSGKYDKLNSVVEGDMTYPMIVYNRVFAVEKSSYEEVFSDITDLNKWKLIATIVFAVITVICGGLAVFFAVKYHKTPHIDIDIGEVKGERLIQGSIGGMNNEGEDKYFSP